MPGATCAGLASFAKPLPVPPIDPSTASRAKRQPLRQQPAEVQAIASCSLRAKAATRAEQRAAAVEFARERTHHRESDWSRNVQRQAIIESIVKPGQPVVKSQATLQREAREQRVQKAAVAAMAASAARRMEAAAMFLQALQRGRVARQGTKEEQAKACTDNLRRRSVACRAVAEAAAAAAGPTGAGQQGATSCHHGSDAPGQPEDATALAGDGGGTSASGAVGWLEAERTQAAWAAATPTPPPIGTAAARAPLAHVAGWTLQATHLPGNPAAATTVVWTSAQWQQR